VRLKNVGIMKTMGGSKQKIVEWITTESILIHIVVFSALMLILPLLVKVLNLLTGYGFQLSDFFSLWNLVLILIMFISSALLTGLLPGPIFSSHRPSILLSKFYKPKGAKYLRNCL
jgi:putative ABC transport system permease protein